MYSPEQGNKHLYFSIFNSDGEMNTWLHSESSTKLRTDKNVQTIKIGDVLLVHDDTPCISWKIAVVEELISGNDGLVRAVNIQTPTGKANRPITKLVPLEISSSEPSELIWQPPQAGTSTSTRITTTSQSSDDVC